MRFSKKFCSVAATVLAAGALTVGISGAASAVSQRPSHGGGGTYNCAHGIWAGYCGTQKSGTGLYIAISPWDSRVVGTRYPQADDAEFVWFADASPSAANNDKYAVFAPNGVPTNEVMADEHGHVVLARASGASDQKWVYVAPGWKNVATGDVLKSTTDNGPILAVHGPSSGSSETWTFVTP